MTAGAGLPTSKLIAESLRRGLGGLECLVGYPASVGGAVRMNAGGRPGETGARVASVTAVGPDGEVVDLTPEECRFAYRSSALGRYVVSEVTFVLPAVEPREYRRRLRKIRHAKAVAQPLESASAGCIFRNPEPGVSAGWLVEECGLLGRRRGGAQVSPKHGNFIVNRGGATAADVLALVEEVRTNVERMRGVRLVSEVEVWGTDHVPPQD